MKVTPPDTGAAEKNAGRQHLLTGPATPADPWWKSGLAGLVTITSLVGFFIALIYLSRQSSSASSESWTRDTYLLTGLEAITFAAVGWLFGKEVQRQEAQQAQQDAKDARQQSDAAKDDAAKGRTLNEAVQAAASANARTIPRREEGLAKAYGAPPTSAPPSGPAPVGIDYLAELGRRLYS